MFESLLFRPNFPVAPARSFDFFTFPNDLIIENGDNKRNYYTDIQFYAYDASFKYPKLPEGTTSGDLVDDAENYIKSLVDNKLEGDLSVNQTIKGPPLANIKLPIPQRINDTMTFSWGQGSTTEIVGGLLQNAAWMSGRLGNLAFLGGGVVSSVGRGAGAAFGLALNPLMFQQFQNPNYREFNLQWSLAPRTKTESATIASMITVLKRASSPGRAYGGLAFTYPLIAMIKFYPNNLTGHPDDRIGGVILKPCIITSVSVDHTPVGAPAFFNGPEGAPVIVAISMAIKELSLWFRDDYDLPTPPERYTSNSGRYNPERRG